MNLRSKGKEAEIPVHHKLEELLDLYLEILGLRNQSNAPLFPIVSGKIGVASNSLCHFQRSSVLQTNS